MELRETTNINDQAVQTGRSIGQMVVMRPLTAYGYGEERWDKSLELNQFMSVEARGYDELTRAALSATRGEK